MLYGAPQYKQDACSTPANANKQGCVFYLLNKQGCVFYLSHEQAGMRVLPSHEDILRAAQEARRKFYLCALKAKNGVTKSDNAV
ncbi:MAG: hypothetical protein ACPGWR_27435 [Ardenticatenaceae bacterium]